MFISTRIQYVPVGMLNWGARYGWPSIREASKGTEGTKALQIKMNAPFKNPHITLMTPGGIARWKHQQSYWFQGEVLFHIHRHSARRK